MLDIVIDDKKINEVLEEFNKKAPIIMKKAINDTAISTRKNMAGIAKERYAAKTADFNKHMNIKKATVNKLVAVISAKGNVQEMLNFKVSPTKYVVGKKRYPSIRGKVLRKSAMKELTRDDNKAFIVKYKNGHLAVASRVDGTETKKSKQLRDVKTSLKPRETIRNFLSPSIPAMLGAKETLYKRIEPDIEKTLANELAKQINREISK